MTLFQTASTLTIDPLKFTPIKCDVFIPELIVNFPKILLVIFLILFIFKRKIFTIHRWTKVLAVIVIILNIFITFQLININSHFSSLLWLKMSCL